MRLSGKHVVVTGAGNGLGAALCRAAAEHGARGIVAADIDLDAATQTADAVGGKTCKVDVSDQAQVTNLVAFAEKNYGDVDIYFSNAGIPGYGGIAASDEMWNTTWRINVLSSVYAAQALMPGWVKRGEGYFVVTSSAAGLLTNVFEAPYTVSKHAAVALAEWLAVVYGHRGVRVSCVCPRGIRTKMFADAPSWAADLFGAGALEPDEAARRVLEGVMEERFMILTHPEVKDVHVAKVGHIDDWIKEARTLTPPPLY